mgnify:CR=1 FL=1
MTLKKIIGQERVKSILTRAVAEKKVAQSYCFWGQEGVGKDAAALELAKLVNCKNPNVNGENIDSCGVCSSCKQISNFQHQNFKLIFSLPSGKAADTKSDDPYAKLSDEQIESIKEQMELKSKNPYYKMIIPNANQIKIASIREIKKSLSLTALTEGRRFVVISRAEEMTSEAANAFLKTLEEPHENITLILTTSRHDMLLPTILSRCQMIHFQPIPEDKLAQFLLNEYNLTEANAKIIASFSEGSYTKAVSFLDEDMQKIREEVVSLFRISLRKKSFRSDLAASIEKLGEIKDKKKIENFLSLLLLWLRDAYYLSKIQDYKNIVNVDQIETLNKFTANFANKNFAEACNSVEKAIHQIRRNVNFYLILFKLFIDLRKIFLK